MSLFFILRVYPNHSSTLRHTKHNQPKCTNEIDEIYNKTNVKKSDIISYLMLTAMKRTCRYWTSFYLWNNKFLELQTLRWVNKSFRITLNHFMVNVVSRPCYLNSVQYNYNVVKFVQIGKDSRFTHRNKFVYQFHSVVDHICCCDRFILFTLFP